MNRRRALLAAVVFALLGLALVLHRGREALRPAAATGERLLVRCPAVAGLETGDPVVAGGATCGVVTGLTVVSDGVIVTCRLAPFPALLQPVEGLIRPADGGGGRRLLLLVGSDAGGEPLRPGELIPGQPALPSDRGELAPLRF